MINDSAKRRKYILERLQNEKSAVSASNLASALGVTRQVIVADVAILRAQGNNIRAEHRGYVLSDKDLLEGTKTIVCKHTDKELVDELYAIVDNGGTVLDVSIDHALYGTLSGDLNLQSRFDVDEYVERQKSTGASPLSALTDGVHEHKILASSDKHFDKIKESLRRLGILVE